MSEVLIKKESFYYSVKLNRPDKHNAFTPEMISQLTDFFVTVEKDKFAGAILLTGAGSSFCAGGDLGWMQSSVKFTYEENLADAKALFQMFDSAAKCSLPIVGYLQGSVYGGGLGLAAICDIAIAEVNSQFCFSEVKLGIVPAVISSFVLRKMNVGKAKELMMTARVFDADTATRSGLVQFSGRELEAQEYLKDTIGLLSKGGPEAVRETKKLIRKVNDLSGNEVAANEIKTECIRVIAERRASGEGQEGLKSFLEKRKPAWLWSTTSDES
ncbi:MAG: enoyl-CoA hydratase-related protein [Bdellovibrionales bacterium]